MHLRIFLLASIAVILLQISSARTIDEPEGGETREMERIVNGYTASKRQFRWSVSLFYNNRYICSASILSPRTVLTAAHCVVFNGVAQPADIFHAIANFRMSSDMVRILFESIQPHPNYTDSNGIINDIAVLTTTEPIPFDDTVQPVCIARKDTNMMEYNDAIAMGWGATNRNKRRPNFPDELQYVNQTIIPNYVCRLAYFGMPVEDSKICAGGFLRGICTGDSGGPLVHMCADKHPVEIGIASYVNKFFKCGTVVPAVFTRVSYFYDFIKQTAVDGTDICEI